MKVAVLYGKTNQDLAFDYFGNKDPPKAFWDFCQLMGDQVDVNALPDGSYTGDMTRGNAFYHKWRGNIEVIYHVAALLDAGEHRQLIGNDIGVIFFLDPGASLNPSVINSLGNVPQIFAAVQPSRGNYRLAFANRTNIQSYPGDIPEGHVIAPSGIRNRILAKLHNGFVMTKKCPPMNRMYYIPRSHAINDLVSKYPPETPKDRKIRENNEFRAHDAEVKRLEALGQSENLIIKVICLTLSNESHCMVKICYLGWKSKTKTLKTKSPIWNQSFVFSMLGNPPLSTEVSISLLRKGATGTEHLGGTVLCVGDIQKIASSNIGPQSYTLRSESGIKGQIWLEFSLESGQRNYQQSAK